TKNSYLSLHDALPIWLESLQQAIQQKDTRLQNARSHATTLGERIALQQRSLDKQQAEQNRRKQQQARLEEEVSKAKAALEEANERYDVTQAASHLADERSEERRVGKRVGLRNRRVHTRTAK